MKKAFALIPGLVVLLVIILVGGYFSLGQKISIEKVKISLSKESQEQLLFEEIKKDLEPRLDKIIGESMIQYSFKTLIDEVLKDKRVKEVYLRREFPSTLIVRVVPREPVLGWVDEKGYIHPVSKDLEVLPRLKSGDLKDHPLLRGKDFLIDKRVREQALKLLNSLPESGHFNRSYVSEILYSKASGFDFILSHPSIRVKMGFENDSEKSSRVEKVLSYIQNRDIKSRVIDSRFNKKVVVRLRNEP